METSPHSYKGRVIPLEKPRVSQPQTKRKRAKRPFPWGYLLLSIILIYFVMAFGGMKWELYRADAQILALEEEKERLLAEQAELLQGKERLNNPVFIERRAREALGLIKPGEKILLPAEPGEVIDLKLEGIDEIGD